MEIYYWENTMTGFQFHLSIMIFKKIDQFWFLKLLVEIIQKQQIMTNVFINIISKNNKLNKIFYSWFLEEMKKNISMLNLSGPFWQKKSFSSYLNKIGW